MSNDGRMWFYAIKSESLGPVPEAEIGRLIGNGAINGSNQVWTDGMGDWAPLETTGLGRYLSAGPGPGRPPQAQSRAPSPSYAPSSTAAPAPGAPAEAFVHAVKTCLSKYVTFAGRARRPEYWWFALFGFIGNIVLSIVDYAVFSGLGIQPLSMIFGLGILLPSLAAAARRLHDTDRSAWWLLIPFVPLIGLIVLLVFLCQRGTQGDNRFGPEEPAARA